MFNIKIDNRLKDTKGSNKDFGDVSTVAIGDPFQLEPIMDKYIFKNVDNSEFVILAPKQIARLFYHV